MADLRDAIATAISHGAPLTDEDYSDADAVLAAIHAHLDGQ